MLSLGDLFPYWIVVTNSIVLTFIKLFVRLVYPFVLLYTHTFLRQAVKKLLSRLKSSNRVVPTDTQ